MFSASKSGQYQGYQISRSVRLRSSASAYFNRTPASAGNRKTWTWSGWVKRSNIGSWGALFASSASLGSGANFEYLVFTSSNTLQWVTYSTSTQANVITTQVFRDPSAWYHVVVAFDSTQATASNRVQMYINGAQVTAFGTAAYPSLNYNSYINLNQIHTIGRDDSGDYFDGYLTEINFIDGQALTPSSFGAYNAYGVWSPMKYNGTYGTNGFYLNFSDPSAATAAAIGKDNSGNGNNWTPNNISVTAGATYDSMLDVPTQWPDGGNGRGNYAVLNPIGGSVNTIQNGNLQLTGTAAGNSQRAGTISVSSGKWYYEVTLTTLPASGDPIIGFSEVSNASLFSQYTGFASTSYAIYHISTNTFLQKVNNNVFTNTNTTIAAQGNVIGVALDLDNGKIWFSKNGTFVDSGDPAAGTNAQYSSITGTYAPAMRGTGGAATTTLDTNFGQRPFAYTPPTGFRALNTQNLPTPTIAKGNQYFNAVLYTGNGSTQSITGVGFQPDLVWGKSRSNGTASHRLYDAVRGVQNALSSNLTSAEFTESGLTAFNSDGFSIGSQAGMNENTATMVAWNWKEGATQGFDIVTYTGNSTASRSISHSLGVTPSMIIVKNRSAVQNWPVAHTSLTVGNLLTLDTTQATVAGGTRLRLGNSTAFTVGDAADYGITNQTGQNYVAYCFAAIAGFSAFGSYTGNGSADGPFVFCGFRPAFVLIKQSDAVRGWNIEDTSRNTFNAMNSVLAPQASSAESTNAAWSVDALSNGFKIRTSDTAFNASGGTYIFAAFAENPFKYSLAR